jgi:PIN domain nuclease of toxin-antitoxin system
VRFLLDTHAFLWFILDDPKLSDQARRLIADRNNEVLVSPASYWEIAIKISIGKYALPEPYDIFMQRELASNAFSILPVLPIHTAVLTDMPFHHRDPFDRLLIAQALTEGIPLISVDANFDAYAVTRIW